MGGGGGLLALRGRAARVAGLGVLSEHAYRTLATIARVHLPSGGPFEAGADRFDLARAFDRFLGGESPENVRDLRRALVLVEYGPLLFERRLATFSNLPPDAQLAHWRSWMESGSLLRRQVSVAFRKFLSLVFYDRPEVWPHVGYPGPAVPPA